MISKKSYRLIIPITLSTALSACGGVSSSPTGIDGSDNASSPPVDLGEANPGPIERTVTGRVADGYIRGATVCVDLNENEACDPDEPSAITGVGGSYDLTIPDGATDKPIVAAIPANAIDEDTGEQVGEPLVFIAPADRPEFLSPITTLVHQELRENPSLDIEEAEQAVKTVLGVSGTDVSLFDDYVARSDPSNNSEGTAASFDYLHDTARVVASMMKDIETQVVDAALSNGVDVAGDQQTQLAIQDIVRNELRDLLPEIAQQVAKQLGNADASDTTTNSSQDTEFDPNALAVSLRPTVTSDGLVERIDANKDRVSLVDSDLRQVLSNGVYWMEFECEYGQYDYDLESLSSEDGSFDLLQIPTPVCEAVYGSVKLGDNESKLVSEDYALNAETGTWELNLDESDNENYFALRGGQWTLTERGSPDGAIEFTSGNSARVITETGVMEIKAVTQDLSGTPIIHHLWEDGADATWFDLVNSEDMFASGAEAYRIGVSESVSPYILFNDITYRSDGECDAYNGNCNVVEMNAENQFAVVPTLAEIIERAAVGATLRVQSQYGYGSTITLTTQAAADGTLSTGGTVTFDFDAYDGYEQVDYEEYGECVTTWIDSLGITDTSPNEPPSLFAPGEFSGTRDELAVLIGEADFSPETLELLAGLVGEEGDVIAQTTVEEDFEHGCETIIDEQISANLQSDDASTEFEYLVGSKLDATWALVEKEGVSMIEIKLPQTLRYGDEGASEEALILAELDGFVRRGARLPDTQIDRVFTYNENAFLTLRSIVESRFDN
ncbi:MAG: hypothetical protein AB8B84_08370 [Granulosicoccus sp.]